MATDLKLLYIEIKKLIDTVDFSKLWCGFRPLKFALYNATECYFNGEYIPKNRQNSCQHRYLLPW